MNSKFNVAINIILVSCALVITYFVIKKEFFSSNNTNEKKKVENWNSLIRSKRSFGNPNSDIKIILFSDYNCPYCNIMNSTLNELIQQRKDIYIAYYEYPREGNESSFEASLASLCASYQNKYLKYRRILFDRNDLCEIKNWQKIADLAGVKDKTTFAKCLNEKLSEEELINEIYTSKNFDIRYTPSLIINGYLIEGSISKNDLQKRISEIHPVKKKK